MPYVKAAEWRRIQTQLSEPATLSPYFESLFGNWRPNPELVREVMASMETRSTDELWEAAQRASISQSRFRGGQGLVQVDERCQLTTLACAEKIIQDTPIEKIKYIAERQDCDDYAEIFEAILRVFYGINCRVVISVSCSHAFIGWPLIINNQVEWRFLEPQTDRWLYVFIGRNEITASGKTREGDIGDVSEALIV